MEIMVAPAVVGHLLETISDDAAREFELTRGLLEEIPKLERTVTLIQSVLPDAEQKQAMSAALQSWLMELKQLCLDADDILDEHAIDVALLSRSSERRKKVFGMMFRCFACMSKTLPDTETAHQIREINRRLEELLEVRDLYFLQAKSLLQDERPERRETSSLLLDEKWVIGREMETKRIIRLLLSSADGELEPTNIRSFSVLPIVGMGGLGKTTLAKLVYNKWEVAYHFEVRMWVYVSTDFDLRRLTKEMIYALSEGRVDDDSASLGSMLQTLRHMVEGRTFLLVLDDVWEVNPSRWEILFEPLKSANKGSMILVTTRNFDAMKLQGQMDPIHLQGLPADDIWSLFLRYAFDGHRNADETIDAKYPFLKDMRGEIVGRLGGSPLAAKTLGSLLRCMPPNAEHWREILNEEMWKARDRYGILSTLEYSYRQLRGDLRQCFAYCSLFPRDYEFGKKELIQLWCAQSFIRTHVDVLMEDFGDLYFDNLRQMFFFEPSPRRDNYYVFPGLMHDLADSVSEDDCLRLEEKKPMKSVPETVRHISICAKEFDQTNMKELCRHEKLRTLLFFGSCQFDASTPALDVLCLKLKRLRVLQLRGCGIRVLPSSAGALKHLRYIDLSENPLEILPESLGNLYKLQVLNLKGTHGSLSKLPSRMSELINLRHLQADSALVASIDGLSKLTNIQELYITGRKVREIGDMSMLRVLDVSHLEQVGSEEEAIQASLKSKEHLQVLRLGWGTNGRGVSSIDRLMQQQVLEALQPAHTITGLSLRGYKGTKSPTWLENLSAFPCLSDLAIAGCPNLGMPISFPATLKRLDLDGVVQTSVVLGSWGRSQDGGEGTSSFSSSTSASLYELHIKDRPNLRSVRELLLYRPIAHIRELHISGCEELTSLPEEGFEHMLSLKKLNIHKCPKLTCPSVQNEQLSLPRSLEAFQIEGCGDEMGGWWWAGLEQLTSLAQLTLGGCPNTLASFFLRLGKCRHQHRLGATLSQLLIRNCKFHCQKESSPSTSSSPPLTPPPTPSEDAAGVFRVLKSLKHLELSGSPNLLRRWGPDGLPSSLKSLTIDGDDNLTDTYLFGRLGSLTSLQSLSITGVDNLICLPSMLSSLPFLEFVKIGSINCRRWSASNRRPPNAGDGVPPTDVPQMPEMEGLQEYDHLVV